MNSTDHSRSIIAVWLFLMAATLLMAHAAAWRPELGSLGFAGLLGAVCWLKGERIADIFMELRGVAGPWRWLVLGWLALVLLVIAYTYLRGLSLPTL